MICQMAAQSENHNHNGKNRQVESDLNRLFPDSASGFSASSETLFPVKSDIPIKAKAVNKVQDELDWLENRSYSQTSFQVEACIIHETTVSVGNQIAQFERKLIDCKSTSNINEENIPSSEPQHLFKLDRKSEISLWNYDSVCTSHIAKYSCATFDCLGNTNIKICQNDNRPVASICRYYTTKKTKRKQAKRIYGIYVTASKNVQNKTLEFISIKEKSCASLSEDKNDFEYQDKGMAGTSTSEEQFVLGEIFDRTAYYNQNLHKYPNNVKLWLEFVSFQDEVFQESRFSSESISGKKIQDSLRSPQACIEKKIAILNRALEANPLSPELKMYKLEVQQDVVDPDVLAEEWDKLLFADSSDVQLWRHYLMFKQTHLATFTVGHVMKLYHYCFKSLNSILDGEAKAVKVTDSFEKDVIGVFEQYCNFLHGSGFTEKAVASYQALIEFNLYRPPSLNLVPSQDCVATFENFWNSGHARFGEPGAKGWAAWIEGSNIIQTRTQEGSVCTEKEEEILAQNLPLSTTWMKMECLRQEAHWLPWRPDFSKDETDEDCEDLDRLVLYDDIAPVLFRLHQSASCSHLVRLFVDFLGLIYFQSADDGLAAFEQLKLFNLHQILVASSVKIDISFDHIWHPSDELIQFLEEVLRQAAYYFSDWHRSFLTCELLRLQTKKLGYQDITSLSKEMTNEISKFGKRLLKEMPNRNDLLLWNSYIRNEWAFGKIKDALSMLQTALTMFTSNISCDDHAQMAGLCSLYRTWAEVNLNLIPMELVQPTSRKSFPSVESKKKVLSSFICMVNNTKFSVKKPELVSAAQVLKARRKFQHLISNLIKTESISTDPYVKLHIVQLVNCFALFEVCAVDIANSLQVFDSVLQLCSVVTQELNSSVHKKAIHSLEEDLILNLQSFLHNCRLMETSVLEQIRAHLYTALSRFPNNAVVLSQFVALDSRSGMAWKLRRYFKSAVRDPTSVYPVLFEVLAEMSRHSKLVSATNQQTHRQDKNESMEGFFDTGTVHRVRTACEKGLQQKVAQHCPLLWRLYLHFEAQYGELKRAEGIFYRALQNCPWAKVLYLDGIKLFGEKQLQELVDLMVEKELRVQVPLEELDLLKKSEPLCAEKDCDIDL